MRTVLATTWLGERVLASCVGPYFSPVDARQNTLVLRILVLNVLVRQGTREKRKTKQHSQTRQNEKQPDGARFLRELSKRLLLFFQVPVFFIYWF